MRSTALKTLATLGPLAAAGLLSCGALAADMNKAVLTPPAAFGTPSTAQPGFTPPAALTPPAAKTAPSPSVTPTQGPQPLRPSLNAQDKAQQVGIDKSYAVNIRVLEQRVSDLEQKLEKLQRSATTQTAHTHSYRAPMCQTFVTLPNLQTALGDTGRYPSGTGVCLNRFSTAGVPDAQTSVPGK